MFELHGKRYFQAVILVLFITIVAYANRSGPPSRYTGGPGEQSCVECHSDFALNSGSGSITITVPQTYTPGQSYDNVTVRVAHAGRQRFGFQLTVIDASGNRAGTLVATDTASTQVSFDLGLGARQYIQHTQQGTSGAGSRTWQFRWTAPSTDAGVVRFFAAGNAANNDGNSPGDYIYTTAVLSEPPGSDVNVSLVTEPAGLVLQAGSKYTINWNVTGQSNVNSYDIRYSTDDGATFPIQNQIFTTTNAGINSYDWTIPNTPATSARIRIQAATQSGRVSEVVSGRFTISGGSTANLPRIFNASVSGKKLMVLGENFAIGSELLMDGKKQKKTSNDETSPTTLLVAKKAGKSIERGQTVILQVRQPDGTLSEEFSFTRPVN